MALVKDIGATLKAVLSRLSIMCRRFGIGRVGFFRSLKVVSRARSSDGEASCN